MRIVWVAMGVGAICLGCGGHVADGPPSPGTDAGARSPGDAGGAPVEADIPPAPPLRTCSVEADCRKGELCNLEASPVSACRTRCTTDDTGKGHGCSASEICNGETCYRVCRPFRAPSDCAEGEWCKPPFEGGYSPDAPPNTGICMAGNTLKHGDKCVDACGPNLECVGGGGLSIGHSYCAPACDSTGTYENSGCAKGKCSSTFSSGCVIDCPPFSGLTSCPEGLSCFPFDELVSEPFSRVVAGRCLRPGTLSEGMPCGLDATGADACGAGLDCVTPPAPFREGPACRRFCDPADDKSCEAGQLCVPYFSFGDQPVGACFPTCTLWQPDIGGGCGAGNWCAPRYTVKGAGMCAPSGTVQTGGACRIDSECAAGSTCRCRGRYDALMPTNTPNEPRFECPAFSDESGHCERVCSPEAAAGEPGACPQGDVCFAPEITNSPPIPTRLGFCRQGCDYDGHVPCARADQICVPHEITGDEADSCFDTPSEGTCNLGVCGDLSLCLNQPESLCTRVCRASAGAIGKDHHPDCLKPTQTCVAIAATIAYGACQ